MTDTPKKTTTRRKPTASADQAPPVYFLSLEVENVLCFKDKQVLDLSDGNGNPAQWTVILGNNGVGKTTLLRCLAGMEMKPVLEKNIMPLISLPSEILSYFSESFSAWSELKLLKEAAATINLQLTYRTPYLSRAQGNEISLYSHPSENAEVRVSVVVGASSTLFHLPNSEKQDRRTSQSEESFLSETREALLKIQEETKEAIVCFSYGATRRMGESSLSEKLFVENSASLFSDKASLINAEEWLLQTDYAAKSATGKTKSRLQEQLDQIFEVLKQILPEIDDIRIAPVDEDRPRPMAEFLTPYGWVHLSSLGLGYRTAIAWMVDLAVRLFRRYPDSPDPLAEPAIVLVDEIDLHLHPKWQRTIMSFLTERFPNTQFIVTAHSPLVVQAAKDANIVLLRREGDRVVIDNNPEMVENWRVDQVLTSVFELPTARSVDLEPLLLRREQILSKAELTEADEAELQTITAQIGSLPTAETPGDIEAMNIIRRAAKLLES